MKTLAALAMTACFTLIGCAESSSPESQSQTQDQTEVDIAAATNKVEADIDGMTCGGCSYQVTTAVKEVPGVTACTADPATGAVKVALDDAADAEATKAEVEKVIAGLSDGKYTIKSITTVVAEPDAEQPAESAPTDEGATDADPA